MSDVVHTLLPLFAFMLIPVWIPLLAVVVGQVAAVVRPRAEHPVVARLQARRLGEATPQPA